MYTTIKIGEITIEVNISMYGIIDPTGEVLYSPAHIYPWGARDEEYFSPLIPIADQSELLKIWKSR